MRLDKSDFRKSSEAGLGVIELTIVVSIAAIVTTFSMIMFGTARARYELRHRADDLTYQIDRARSIAIKSNKTLAMGFSSSNQVFGLTCTDCPEAKAELPPFSIPKDIKLSAYPTLSIKGNGTITSTSQSLTLTDKNGRQITIWINNSGRVVVGDISEPTSKR